MRNSNLGLLGNLSIGIPTESRIRELSEYDDKSVIINDGESQNLQLNFNEDSHIQKWLECREKVQKRYISQNDNDPNKNSNCYMIEIDDVHDVGYRKKVSYREREKQRQRERNRKNTQAYQRQEESQTKVYLKIFANFVNTQTMNYSSRTLQFNLIQLQQKSNNVYKVTNPRLTIFFHTKHTAESHFKVRIQLSVVQSNIISLQEVVQNQEYLGYFDLDPFKGLKTKQRGQIYSQKLNANLDAAVLYTVLVSDTFKIIQKLVPANCLCSCQETIAGLAGRKLPNTLLGLNHSIQYTQLHSLKIDISSVSIPDTLIHSKIKQCEQYLRHFQNVQTPVSSIKQVKLQCVYHNGWTGFCETSAKIQDKMQIQKKSSKKTSNQIIKIRQFTSQQLINLPFIFLDQEAILYFQVVAKIEVKGKTDLAYIQNIMLPICYTYYVVNKISVDQKQIRTLYIGEGLNQKRSEFANKKNETNGKIQFYITIQNANKMQLSKHLITLHSNKSHTNIEVDKILLQKQRMIRQNRKLRHQNRIKKIQLNQEIPILDTTNFKENLYRNQIQRMRDQRRQKEEVLEYLKRKIKEMTPAIEENSGQFQNFQQDQYVDINNPNKKFIERANAHFYYDSVFYKAALQKSLTNNSSFPIHHHNPDTIKPHIYPLVHNPNSANIFESGQAPLDIIKTQLLQKNYSYAVFINLISILPVSEDRKLPRKFYFQTNFYKNQYLRSCDCTINEMTGQIQVFQQNIVSNRSIEQNNKFKRTQPKKQQNLKTQTRQEQAIKKQTKVKIQKIFFIEVGPSLRAKNNQNNFIQFICYLYHSELQIRIFDSLSKIQFGQCYVKLKDIIRMRRNQVAIVKDVWVKKSGENKGKLKVQIKSIRKQASNSQIQYIKPQITQLQSLSMEPEARQLHRIAQFKKHKQIKTGTGADTSYNKIQKIFNEQLTKQQLFINVSRMKGQFIKIDLINRKNQTQMYRIMINDPDKPYMATQQLVVVNSILYNSIKQTRWWKYLNSIQQAKYGNIIITDDRNCFELSPGQTGSILLYYYSQRKYQGSYVRDRESRLYDVSESVLMGNQNDRRTFSNKNSNIHNNTNSHEQQPKKSPAHSHRPTNLLKIYNHKRCIDLTLINASNNYINSIYKINIVPQPDFPNISYKHIRKSNSKLSIQIPYLQKNNYVIYIDDPTIISSLNQAEGYASLDCYAGAQGESSRFNVSILSPFPENRLLLNYQFQIWGACEIYVELRLWEMQSILVDLHSSICLKKGLEYIIVLSEDQKIIQVKDKNPIKVNQKQAKTMIRLTATACNIGINHYQLNIISPVDYSIIYRYTIKLQTIQPQITQKITLRIKLTDKLLEEPFGFKNQMVKRQKFRILSTHPHILWCPQDSIDVEAHGEKKVKIKINAEELMESQAVILTFVGEKSKFHYLFILDLDNQL